MPVASICRHTQSTVGIIVIVGSARRTCRADKTHITHTRACARGTEAVVVACRRSQAISTVGIAVVIGSTCVTRSPGITRGTSTIARTRTGTIAIARDRGQTVSTDGVGEMIGGTRIARGARETNRTSTIAETSTYTVAMTSRRGQTIFAGGIVEMVGSTLVARRSGVPLVTETQPIATTHTMARARRRGQTISAFAITLRIIIGGTSFTSKTGKARFTSTSAIFTVTNAAFITRRIRTTGTDGSTSSGRIVIAVFTCCAPRKILFSFTHGLSFQRHITASFSARFCIALQAICRATIHLTSASANQWLTRAAARRLATVGGAGQRTTGTRLKHENQSNE